LNAKGLTPLLAPLQPQLHPYLTFEYQLPLTFYQDLAVHLESEEIVSEAIESNRFGKPELKRRFYSGIKAFKDIIALYFDFVYQYHKCSENSAWMQIVVEE
jgi:hypothetical protein